MANASKATGVKETLSAVAYRKLEHWEAAQAQALSEIPCLRGNSIQQAACLASFVECDLALPHSPFAAI